MSVPEAIYSDGWLSSAGSTPFTPTGVRLVDLCEELTEYLNASVLATPCATRSYWQEIDAATLDGPLVLVRPAQEDATDHQNDGIGGGVQNDLTLSVAVIDRADDEAAMDAALGMLQDIEESTRAKTLSGYARLTADCPLAYDVDTQRETKVFRGLLRLTYRGIE
jgi:hypothetical protein